MRINLPDLYEQSFSASWGLGAAKEHRKPQNNRAEPVAHNDRSGFRFPWLPMQCNRHTQTIDSIPSGRRAITIPSQIHEIACGPLGERCAL